MKYELAFGLARTLFIRPWHEDINPWVYIGHTMEMKDESSESNNSNL